MPQSRPSLCLGCAFLLGRNSPAAVVNRSSVFPATRMRDFPEELKATCNYLRGRVGAVNKVPSSSSIRKIHRTHHPVPIFNLNQNVARSQTANRA